jgi:hypothetical protein
VTKIPVHDRSFWIWLLLFPWSPFNILPQISPPNTTTLNAQVWILCLILLQLPLLASGSVFESITSFTFLFTISVTQNCEGKLCPNFTSSAVIVTSNHHLPPCQPPTMPLRGSNARLPVVTCHERSVLPCALLLQVVRMLHRQWKATNITLSAVSCIFSIWVLSTTCPI